MHREGDRTQFRTILTMVLGLALAVVVGCARSPKRSLITTLVDLVADRRTEGKRARQHTLLSLTGGLPMPSVGDLYYYSHHRAPISAVAIGDEHSYVREGVLEPSGTPPHGLPELKSIAIAISGARLAAANLVAARIRRRILEDELTRAEDAQATALTTEIAKERALESSAATSIASMESVVLGSLDKSPILVFRWNVEDIRRIGGIAGAIFGATKADRHANSGFAVASGIRIQTLRPGRDLPEAIRRAGISDGFGRRLSLTTYSLQVKHIIYHSAAEFEDELKMKLSLSKEQLSGALALLKEDDILSIESTLTRVSNLSNLGALDGMVWTESRLPRYSFDPGHLPWCGKVAVDATCFETPQRNEGWLPLLVIQTEARSFASIFGERP